jgi:hypothetical protein
VIGVAGGVVLRGRGGCSNRGSRSGAALSYRGLLGGRGGCGFNVPALHLDAA